MARSLRTTAIVFVCLLLVLGLIGLIGLSWLRGEGGRSWTVAQIQQVVRDEAGLELTIGALEGDLLSTIVLNRVTVADPEGQWLSLERATIEWQPWALTGRHLHVRSLTLLALEVSRAPELPDDPADPGSDDSPSDEGSTFPIDISLDRLAAQPITLGAALLGEEVILKLDGRLAAHDGERLEAALTVARHDGPGGTLDADLTYRLSDRQFGANLTLTEPSGALVRGLSGLEDAGATTVTLESSGSLSDVKGDLNADVAGLGTAEAAFTLALDQTIRLGASGQVNSLWRPEGLPAGLWDGALDFSLDADLVEGTKITAHALALETTVAAIQADGTFDTQAETLDARAAIEVKDQTAIDELVAPLRLASPTLSVTATGSLERPQLGLQAGVAELAAPGVEAGTTALSLTLAPAADTRLEDLQLAFSGSGRIVALTVDGQDELAPLLGPELSWQADGSIDVERETLALSEARISGEELTVTAQGVVDGAPGLDLETTVDLLDLSVLQDLIGFAPEGQFRLAAEVTSTDLGGGLDTALSGQFTDFKLGAAELDSLLGRTPVFDTDLSLPDYRRATLSDLSVTLGAGSLEGDLDIDLAESSLAGEVGFAAPELAVLSALIGQAISGTGRLDAALSGTLDDPAAEGRLRLSNTAVGPLVAADLTADFDARNLVSGPQGRAAIALDSRDVTLGLKSGFQVEKDILRLTGLSLQGDGIGAEGNLQVPLSGPPASGQLTLSIADLGPSLSLLAIDAAGSGRAALDLDAAKGRQTLGVTAELQGLRLTPPDGAPITVRRAELAAQSSDLLAGGLSDLRLTLAEASAGPVALDSLALTGKGDPTRADFELAFRGDLQGPLALDAAGELAQPDGLTALTLDRLTGRLLGQDLALSEPARLTFGDQAIRVGGLRASFGTARLSLDAEVSEARTEAQLYVEEVPLALAALAAPDLEIAGTASLQARLTGPSNRPTGTISFEARDVDLSLDLDNPPLQIKADGRLDGNRLTLDAELAGFARESAALELALPLRLAVMPFVAELEQSGTLDGSFKWSGELSEIWALVPVDGHRAAGPAAIDLAVSGTPSRPRADGQITLSKGEYENFETGTLLRDLAMVLDLRGDRLVLESLSANDGGGGSLKGSGSVDLVPERDFPFSFTTDFNAFTLVRRDDVTAASNGQLDVGGSLTETAVEGSFETTTVEIRIPDSLPPQIVDLEVTEQGGKTRPTSDAEEEAEKRGGSEVDLDLSITLPAQVFVRGRGLETEWKGWLKITGTAAAPVIEGELENLRGRLRVVGKDFSLEQSKISFAGTSDIAPLLDIRAVNESDDLKVTVTVTGTPDQPTITLSSSPSLPQEEILARILFGKSTTQLSAIEAVQLASSVAELSGSGLGGAGVLDFTRDLIGVDVLDVGTSDGAAGGAQVSAGKYITDDVYVGVKQGTTPGSSEVEVEVELTPNISVGSDVGATGESNIGVQFKLDY